ncbi:oxygen-independent coproporphyrinogen III oxidase [uncultured Draconibacterium sp.]|uniref:oxygen-independent coproporphyrinogen III oxidase n=1 Tax=uncultured Draconibacterium sp. TaxID=1573823 RepID=UPI0025F94BF5|nr:oxygen-independent coproporphyrinogen III oxidase [uncultured Draconibacterium sp.]
MNIPQNLIEKYNTPVPRYTSYPPANFFSADFSPEEYVKVLEESNRENPQNISIYIHIPFCPKICHFCGCNTHLTRDKNKMQVYVDALKKEIRMVRALLDSKRKVSQVHWGGGTPNSLPIAMIEDIMNLIHELFEYIPNPEIAMECHPAMLNQDYINRLVALKFNRFSLGIQDFNQQVLYNVNRDASVIPEEELVALIRSHKNTSVNFDFIYGLPFQDEDSFAETIKRAISLSPDRLVTFSYAHVPWVKKAQKILDARGLPSATKKLAMFEVGYRLLTENGYDAIGLDHFARPDDELNLAFKNKTLHRNFQGYCTRETTGQVYAFGATGISQLESAYAQNAKDTNVYVDQINKGKFTIEKGYRLNPDEKIIRHVINEVMCNYYFSWHEAEQVLKTTTEHIKQSIAYNESHLMDFVNEGLLSVTNESISVSEKGRFFVRNIAASLDPNMRNATQKFSKAL